MRVCPTSRQSVKNQLGLYLCDRRLKLQPLVWSPNRLSQEDFVDTMFQIENWVHAKFQIGTLEEGLLRKRHIFFVAMSQLS